MYVAFFACSFYYACSFSSSFCSVSSLLTVFVFTPCTCTFTSSTFSPVIFSTDVFTLFCISNATSGILVPYSTIMFTSIFTLFSSFDYNDAYTLGTMLRERGLTTPKPIAIRIVFDDIILYQYFLPGTDESNKKWMNSKQNTVTDCDTWY